MKATKSFELSSKYYDLIYQDKDYEKEVAFIEDIFAAFNKPRKILEIGCGTGNYTQILHRKGYEVTGLDISENMIRVAKKKCTCNFKVGDIAEVNINKKFDACIAMFAVISYITETSRLIKALANIRKHLKTNGLLIFDVWNGLAVMRILPDLRVKELENENIKILRIAYPNLKAFNHVCEVKYKLLVLDKKNRKCTEFEEDHIVRFYFPQEMIFFLEMAGFEVLKACPFLDLNGHVDEAVWNMTLVARAVGEC